MGKKKQQYDGGHYSRREYSKYDLCKDPGDFVMPGELLGFSVGL